MAWKEQFGVQEEVGRTSADETLFGVFLEAAAARSRAEIEEAPACELTGSRGSGGCLFRDPHVRECCGQVVLQGEHWVRCLVPLSEIQDGIIVY